MSDDPYNKKLQSLQAYVPFLENLLADLKKPNSQNKEQQLEKIQSIYNIITNNRRKYNVETLIECEEILNNINKGSKCKEDQATASASSVTTTKDTVDAGKIQMTHDILQDLGQTSKSPSSETEISIAHKSTENVYEQIIDLCEEDTSPEEIINHVLTSEERYNAEKPSIYSTAGESSSTSVKPLTLTAPDTTKPLLTDADLEVLMNDIEVPIVEEKNEDFPKNNETETVKLTTNVKSSTLLMIKLKSKKEEKVLKEPASIFGNILSNIDDSILKDNLNKKKEKGVSTDTKQEKRPTQNLPSKKLVVDIQEQVYKRLADKYNRKSKPKPDTSIDMIISPVDKPVQQNVPPFDAFLNNTHNTYPHQPVRQPPSPIYPENKTNNLFIPTIEPSRSKPFNLIPNKYFQNNYRLQPITFDNPHNYSQNFNNRPIVNDAYNNVDFYQPGYFKGYDNQFETNDQVCERFVEENNTSFSDNYESIYGYENNYRQRANLYNRDRFSSDFSARSSGEQPRDPRSRPTYFKPPYRNAGHLETITNNDMKRTNNDFGSQFESTYSYNKFFKSPYDDIYTRLDVATNKSFASPVDSSYYATNTNRSRGYGRQNFKIQNKPKSFKLPEEIPYAKAQNEINEAIVEEEENWDLEIEQNKKLIEEKRNEVVSEPYIESTDISIIKRQRKRILELSSDEDEDDEDTEQQNSEESPEEEIKQKQFDADTKVVTKITPETKNNSNDLVLNKGIQDFGEATLNNDAYNNVNFYQPAYFKGYDNQFETNDQVCGRFVEENNKSFCDNYGSNYGYEENHRRRENVCNRDRFSSDFSARSSGEQPRHPRPRPTYFKPPYRNAGHLETNNDMRYIDNEFATENKSFSSPLDNLYAINTNRSRRYGRQNFKIPKKPRAFELPEEIPFTQPQNEVNDAIVEEEENWDLEIEQKLIEEKGNEVLSESYIESTDIAIIKRQRKIIRDLSDEDDEETEQQNSEESPEQFEPNTKVTKTPPETKNKSNDLVLKKGIQDFGEGTLNKKNLLTIINSMLGVQQSKKLEKIQRILHSDESSEEEEEEVPTCVPKLLKTDMEKSFDEAVKQLKKIRSNKKGNKRKTKTKKDEVINVGVSGKKTNNRDVRKFKLNNNEDVEVVVENDNEEEVLPQEDEIINPPVKKKRKLRHKAPEIVDQSYKSLHDIEYYYKANTRIQCLLCSHKGSSIIAHYNLVHGDSEVLISRFHPDVVKEAITESYELNLAEIEPVEMLTNKKRSKFSFSCRFCSRNYHREFTEIFYDHLTIHTGEFRNRCNICRYASSNLKNIKLHMVRKHKSKVPLISEPPPLNFKYVFGYLCKKCNYVQLHKENTEKHIALNHPNLNVELVKISMSPTNFVFKGSEVESETSKCDSRETRNDEDKEESVPLDENYTNSHLDDNLEESRLQKIKEISDVISPTFSSIEMLKPKLDNEVNDANEIDDFNLSINEAMGSESEKQENRTSLSSFMAIDNYDSKAFDKDDVSIKIEKKIRVLQTKWFRMHKENDNILYICTMSECTYFDSDSDRFKTHCSTHEEPIPPLCNICNVKIECEGSSINLLDLFNHVKDHFYDASPKMNIDINQQPIMPSPLVKTEDNLAISFKLASIESQDKKVFDIGSPLP